MKIIIYNSVHQFALSRKQIEVMQEILPKRYFSSIQEFHLTTCSPAQERFEYDYKTKIAYFEYIVQQKVFEITADAVKHVLIGLKRINEKDTFGYFLKESEKIRYQSFVDEWKTKCLKQFDKL